MLQLLARKNNPPPKRRRRISARQARWRERQRAGRAIFRVEADHDALVLALIETGRICERDTLERRKVEAALADVLHEFGRRWREFML